MPDPGSNMKLLVRIEREGQAPKLSQVDLIRNEISTFRHLKSYFKSLLDVEPSHTLYFDGYDVVSGDGHTFHSGNVLRVSVTRDGDGDLIWTFASPARGCSPHPDGNPAAVALYQHLEEQVKPLRCRVHNPHELPKAPASFQQRAAAAMAKGDFQFQIQTLTGKSVPLFASPSHTIGDIKDQLEELEGVPAYQQSLIVNGVRLEDERTLAEYSITEGSQVHLVLRLCGGMFHQTSGRKDFDEQGDRVIHVLLPDGKLLEYSVYYAYYFRDLEERVLAHMAGSEQAGSVSEQGESEEEDEQAEMEQAGAEAVPVQWPQEQDQQQAATGDLRKRKRRAV